MFENLIAQEEFVQTLRSDIRRNELPPAMLFTGPENSGKLTAALETARVLSCDAGTADWGCPCPACERHRLLSHPDLLLLGPRSFRAEILAAGEILVRGPNKPARYLFLRAVKKLTRRFDPVLYEGEENRLSKAAAFVQSLEELADAAGPGREDDAEASEAAAKALPLADKLESLLPDSLPIFQVRAAERWARLAPFGGRKVAVIENAERMLESSRNALLKILEEPPRTAVFILLSSRPSSLIPTILSRVRSYPFRPRDAEASREVLAKVFRAKSQEPEASLDAFLAARKPLSREETDELALRFLSVLCVRAAAGGGFLPPALREIAENARDRRIQDALEAVSEATKGFGAGNDSFSYAFPAFLRSLSSIFRGLLPSSDADTVELLSGWSARVRDALLRSEAYNIAPSSLLERLAEELSLSLEVRG